MGRGTSKALGSFAKSLVKITVFHGTNIDNITKFSNQGKESNGAIFFSDDADYAEEEAYVKQEAHGGKQTIYEAKLNIQNPLEVTLGGKEFSDPIVERKYIKQAKEMGKDSVIFHSDTGNPYLDQTFYAVFSPKQIKIQKKNTI